MWVHLRILRIFIVASFLTPLSVLHINAIEPTLTVAAINLPPFMTKDLASGLVSGLIIEQVQVRAKACNITVQFIFAPAWARALKMAILGKTDGLIPVSDTAERREFFDLSMPAIKDVNPSIIVRADSPFKKYTGLSMLKGKRVAKRAKAYMGKAVETFLESGQVSVTKKMTSKGLAEALFSGQVDFIIDATEVVRHHIGFEQMEEKMRVLEPSLGQVFQYFALSKKRSASFAAGTPASDCLLGISTHIKGEARH